MAAQHPRARRRGLGQHARARLALRPRSLRHLHLVGGIDRDVVDGCPAAVLPAIRLGDDDLLGDRRRQPRPALSVPSAGPGAAGVAARDAPDGGPAPDAAAPAAAAFPVQHPQHHLGPDAPRRRSRRRHAGPARRPAAAVVRVPGGAGGGAGAGARLPAEVRRHRAGAVPGAARRDLRHRARRPGLSGAKPFAAATRRKRHQARHRTPDRPRARAGAGDARRFDARAGSARRRRRRAGLAAARSRTGRRAVEHPSRGSGTSTATSTASRCGGRPVGDCRW